MNDRRAYPVQVKLSLPNGVLVGNRLREGTKGLFRFSPNDLQPLLELSRLGLIRPLETRKWTIGCPCPIGATEAMATESARAHASFRQSRTRSGGHRAGDQLLRNAGGEPSRALASVPRTIVALSGLRRPTGRQGLGLPCTRSEPAGVACPEKGMPAVLQPET
jgi:hypothetical protein